MHRGKLSDENRKIGCRVIRFQPAELPVLLYCFDHRLGTLRPKSATARAGIIPLCTSSMTNRAGTIVEAFRLLKWSYIHQSSPFCTSPQKSIAHREVLRQLV